MTDKDGKPVVDLQGKTYSQRLDGENPRIIAARMTKKSDLSCGVSPEKWRALIAPWCTPRSGLPDVARFNERPRQDYILASPSLVSADPPGQIEFEALGR